MICRPKAAAPVDIAALVRAGLAKVGLGRAGSYRANRPAASESLSLRRIVVAAALAGLLAAGGTSGAQAQQPASPAQPAASPSGWTFNIAPYMWFANLNATTNLNLPPAVGGGTVTSTTNIGFDELLQHLNAAVMVAGGAQYDRFSVLTDFMYMNLGGTAAQFKSVNFPDHPHIPISGSLQSSQGLNLNASIWTLAGGYTVLQGDWGNLDVIAGFRYLEINARLDYSLGFTITGPLGRSETFGGVGSASGSLTLVNGIGGFRGRVRIGDTGLFVPYYFDIGAGGSNLTWQIASGVGYHLGWGDVSVTYRYLSFQQGDDSLLQHLWIKGPMVMADFKF
jgi:hypothetical protein